MFLIMILLAMAYAQDSYGRNQPAYVWAGGFALINFIFGVLGGSFLVGIISAIIMGLYAWGYFVVLRRFSDQTLLWLIICMLGLVLPFLLPFLMAG